MKNYFVILYVIGVAGLSLGKVIHLSKNAEITPNSTLVGGIDGKEFFVDFTEARNKSDASSYCNALGLRLGEMTTLNQFIFLDAAVVPGWDNNMETWTNGLGRRSVHQNSEKPSVDLYLQDISKITEGNIFEFALVKAVNQSYILVAKPEQVFEATLCETLQ